jgi:hypothetical protein
MTPKTPLNPEEALAASTPTQPKAEGIRRQQLSHQEFFKLCQWLQRNRKELLEVPTTLTALANIASMASSMNRPISPSSIASALEATGLRMKTSSLNRRASGKDHSEDIKRIARLLLGLIEGATVAESDVEWLKEQL